MKYMESLGAYAAELAEFIDTHWLPQQWFTTPDHVAIKCADAADFDETIEAYKSHSTQISYVEMDGRRLATARLSSSLAVAKLGEVSWVEIMEPRPEKVGKDVIGFEHMEFLFPDFAAVRSVLDDRNVSFEMEENPGHAWVNIVLNDKGQELKLNNKLLSEAVAREIEAGEAIVIL